MVVSYRWTITDGYVALGRDNIRPLPVWKPFVSPVSNQQLCIFPSGGNTSCLRQQIIVFYMITTETPF